MAIPTDQHKRFDVVVIGGGHAGCEAAWAGASLGARVALVTLDPAKVGVMSCNPAIGGLAKGQIVREIDAMGGLMPLAADATGIQFRVLNQSRGPAVRGPRAQCDRHAYAEAVQRLIASRSEITVLTGVVEDLLVEDGCITGVVASLRAAADPSGFSSRVVLHAQAVVLTTGTFMRGLMHTGDTRTPGGRTGEAASSAISRSLEHLGFTLGRLKTGTPPRLLRRSIDWLGLDAQRGDLAPKPLSDLSQRGLNPLANTFPAIEQVECRVTRTTPATHALIRANLHRAPIYNGAIDSTGPRYCPSIEDKVVRFADRESHHVFLEPESLRDEIVYCNGVSTSLPEDVQLQMVRSMPGCERAQVQRFGYAVEYDCVPTHQIDATCMTKRAKGLFFAGQINGTTGYEEAAGQGLLAGLNAGRYAQGREGVALRRDQAYIGVLMDDLVTKMPVEPYRMFTSRAEHRLILRADNAWDRLTPLARELGLIHDERWRVHQDQTQRIAALERLVDTMRIDGQPLARVIRKPEFTERNLAQCVGEDVFSREIVETVYAKRKYAGYIDRQRAEIRRHVRMEARRIPSVINFQSVKGLRTEAREALSRFQPRTFGEASRLEGVNPTDVTLLLVAATRAKRDRDQRD